MRKYVIFGPGVWKERVVLKFCEKLVNWGWNCVTLAMCLAENGVPWGTHVPVQPDPHAHSGSRA